MKNIFEHKSDCAQHNEPACPNEKCNCGADGKNLGWLTFASNLEYINNDIIKGYFAGVNFKPFTAFETEYQLENFREIQSQYFDQYNEKYSATPLDSNIGKQMLMLINQMEIEIKNHAKFVNY